VANRQYYAAIPIAIALFVVYCFKNRLNLKTEFSLGTWDAYYDFFLIFGGDCDFFHKTSTLRLFRRIENRFFVVSLYSVPCRKIISFFCHLTINTGTHQFEN
jgi:hypothetical protein